MTSPLTAFRLEVAAALDELAPVDDAWPVHEGPVDALSPPCFVLAWPDPQLVPLSVCGYASTLAVDCVGARMDPAPGYVELEELLAAAIPALRAAGFALVNVGGALAVEAGGIHYLAARILVTQSVSFDPEG